MLVLSRSQGEELVFQVEGRTFTVTVTSINSNRVKLGIEATKDVVVMRREVWDELNAASTPAAEAHPAPEVDDEYAGLYLDLGGSE